ncbi:MAG: hypothetical protein KJO18_09450, partial [Acidimicrobiia bacterium]|nr:hypothetical protein [Acidimicrobiia bacterium]
MLHDYESSTAQSVTALTDDALEKANQLVDGVTTHGGTHTYANTVAPLEAAGTILADAYGAGAFLGRAHPDQDVRDVAIEAEERLTKWGNDVISRRDLYEAVKAFSESAEKETLPADRARVLDEWLRDFRRAGHQLDEGKRERLHELRTHLIELEVEFGKNVDEWQDHIDMTLDELDGLPPEYIERLGEGKAPGTYRVTMDYPEYTPFIQQARNREMRRKLQFKFWNRAKAANGPLLAEAVKTRQQIADLLGYATWAHYAMEVKMAKSPDAVADLYDSIIPGLEKRAAAELAALQEMLEQDHPGEQLQSWDWAYYANEQRKRDFGIDPNEVAEYFPLGEVMEGMFDITSDVFDLVYRRIEDAATWHPDVQVYEIQNADNEEPIAYFYADLFPRKGK